MANLKTKYFWDVEWNQLTGGSLVSPFGTPAAKIDEALTLYVATTGAPNAPGTVDQPFANIQNAIDYLANFEIAAQVVVKVAAGTYDGFLVPELNITGIGTVIFDGAMTVLDSGTIGSSAAVANASAILDTVTDGTKSWTVDTFKGAMLRQDTLSGNYFNSTSYNMIQSNTSTVLTTVSTNTLPVASTLYSIVRPAVIINDTLDVSGISQSAVILKAAIACYGGKRGGFGTTRVSRVQIIGFKFQSSISQNLPAFMREGCIDFTACHFAPVSLGSVLNFVSTKVSFISCYFEIKASGGNAAVQCIFGTGPDAITNIRSCYFRNSVATGGTGISSGSGLAITTACFESLTVGLNLSNGTGPAAGNTSYFNCTTGISVAQGYSAVKNTSLYLSGCGTGISVLGPCSFQFTLGAIISSTTAIVATTGALVRIGSTATFTTNTNDLSVDGVTSTIAAMRAASPKTFPTTANIYGTLAYE